jgi:hypothetical protein
VATLGKLLRRMMGTAEDCDCCLNISTPATMQS